MIGKEKGFLKLGLQSPWGPLCSGGDCGIVKTMASQRSRSVHCGQAGALHPSLPPGGNHWIRPFKAFRVQSFCWDCCHSLLFQTIPLLRHLSESSFSEALPMGLGQVPSYAFSSTASPSPCIIRFFIEHQIWRPCPV